MSQAYSSCCGDKNAFLYRIIQGHGKPPGKIRLTIGVAGFCIASFLKLRSGNNMHILTGFALYRKI